MAGRKSARKKPARKKAAKKKSAARKPARKRVTRKKAARSAARRPARKKAAKRPARRATAAAKRRPAKRKPARKPAPKRPRRPPAPRRATAVRFRRLPPGISPPVSPPLPPVVSHVVSLTEDGGVLSTGGVTSVKRGERVAFENLASRQVTVSFSPYWPFEPPATDITVEAGERSDWYTVAEDALEGEYSAGLSYPGSGRPPGDPILDVDG